MLYITIHPIHNGQGRTPERPAMKLSQHNALQIVSNINEIINRKMNIINTNGTIIASTDESRIGTFHSGAKKLIDEHLSELIINEEDSMLGTRPGINYPLTVNGETIGVVGITGSDAETLSYAKIVKRMTELLVHELSIKEEQETEENIKNRYLDEWLSGDPSLITKAFIEKGLAIGIDIRIPRRFLAMTVYDQSNNVSLDRLRKLETAKRYLQQLSSYGAYHVSLASSSFLIAGIPELEDSSILGIAKDYRKLIVNRYQVQTAIGIDSRPSHGDDGYLFAYRACTQAKKALSACLRTHQRNIRFYDDLNMELFTDELSDTVKREYIHKIFRGMGDEEIFHAVQILEIYYNTDGSINKSAQQLFIHKNTMQNRLKQIHAKTGHDPRSIRASSLFYNAIHFYRELGRDI